MAGVKLVKIDEHFRVMHVKEELVILEVNIILAHRYYLCSTYLYMYMYMPVYMYIMT